MILIDYEGEILLDIIELVDDETRGKIARGLVEFRGYTPHQIVAGMERVCSVPTNAYPKARVPRFTYADFDSAPVAWWRRWFR